MAHLYLPAAHTEADLVLAGLIAEAVDSAELYVAWTPAAGRAVPEIVAELRAAAPRWTESFTILLEAVRELWGYFLGRDPHGPAPAPAGQAAGEQPAPAPGEAQA